MRRIEAPEVSEIGRDGLRVARHKNTDNHQAGECGYLGNREQVLHGSAQLQAKDVEHREKYHNHDPTEVLRVQANIHVAQHHGTNLDWWHFRDVPDPLFGGDILEEISHELAKGHTHGG